MRLKLSPAAWAAVKKHAETSGKSESKILRELVEWGLEEYLKPIK
jgi:hypothetical protein